MKKFRNFTIFLIVGLITISTIISGLYLINNSLAHAEELDSFLGYSNGLTKTQLYNECTEN